MNISVPHLFSVVRCAHRLGLALQRHVPRSYMGRVNLLVSEDHYRNDPTMGWSELAGGNLQIHRVPGDRRSYLGQHDDRPRSWPMSVGCRGL